MGQTGSFAAARTRLVGARVNWLIDKELKRARAKHPKPLNSEPEGWAVIQVDGAKLAERDPYFERRVEEIVTKIDASGIVDSQLVRELVGLVRRTL